MMQGPSTAMSVVRVPIERIRPGVNQARRSFPEYALQELADSIRESGVIQPVLLRTRGEGYELLAGERRWRAAALAGVYDLPAIIRDDLDEDEAFIFGLIENLQRESLTPTEQANGLRQLADQFAMTHDEIGARIGKSREYVSNTLRLLSLHPEVLELLDGGRIQQGHAKALASLPRREQLLWARQCAEQQWPVRRLEAALTAQRRGGSAASTRQTSSDSDIRRLEQRLSDHFGFAVTLENAGGGAGMLRFEYQTLDDFDALLERLGLPPESL